jgi:hypothetical protein
LRDCSAVRNRDGARDEGDHQLTTRSTASSSAIACFVPSVFGCAFANS